MRWSPLRTTAQRSGSKDAEDDVTESERLLFGGRLRLDLAWLRHEYSFLDLNLRGMVVRLPHLLTVTARLARQANARALRQVVGAEVGRGAVQAASMIAINHVLTALLAAGPTTQRLSAALPALVAVVVCTVIGAGLRAVSTVGTGRLEPAVERVATEIDLTASAKVEMAAIEDPDFHRRAESARFGAGSARRVIQYSTSVINALMSLLASIGVLTVLHPALLPVIVMMTLPSAWATLVIARRRYMSFKVSTQHARAGRLLSELLTSTRAAAEIRLHGIAAFLLHRFRAMSETAEQEHARLARLAARTGPRLRPDRQRLRGDLRRARPAAVDRRHAAGGRRHRHHRHPHRHQLPDQPRPPDQLPQRREPFRRRPGAHPKRSRTARHPHPRAPRTRAHRQDPLRERCLHLPGQGQQAHPRRRRPPYPGRGDGGAGRGERLRQDHRRQTPRRPLRPR
ncbi:hypothetical protein ACH4FX_38180 [Streptomyces sp. NPDC018019]|uniref:hypothetical protein n=1 Tax=Streptomyces sp. NPDC018019 TaxID=3365030 RepID=UPI00379476A9